ncbi:MAG: NHL repeat-containing protein, partial [bacterium]
SAPSLTITQPNEGGFVNTQQVLVKGTVSDVTATQVTVNNVVASVTNGQYMATVPINNEGANTLTVKATDSANNQTTLTRNITRDTISPVLTVTQPQEAATFTTPEVTVTGSFTDITPVTVMINNITATIAGNSFTATVALNNGANTLQVIARDAAGNQSQIIRNVTRNSGGDTTPPTLVIFSPVEGSVLRSVTVSGNVVDQSSITLTINGTQVFVNDEGNFLLEELFLPEGLQRVNILAVDTTGSRSEVLRNVNIDATPPVISNISPAQRTLIASQQAIIQGKVSDLSSPVTVFVNQTQASVNQQGMFTATIPIVEGENQIILFATDAAGNDNSELLTLFGKDFTPPQVPTLFPVISPTRLGYQTIEGRAEAGAQINILGGSSPITTTAALEANVNLRVGVNNLSITATDSTSNVSAASQISIVSNPSLALLQG